MSHLIALVYGDGNTSVIPLGRVDQNGAGSSTRWYKAARITVTAMKTGASAATFVIAPIVVADNTAAPAPAAIQVADVIPSSITQLDSATNPSITIGQQYSLGYSPSVYAEITATHLMVNTIAGGVIQIIVD